MEIASEDLNTERRRLEVYTFQPNRILFRNTVTVFLWLKRKVICTKVHRLGEARIYWLHYTYCKNSADVTIGVIVVQTPFSGITFLTERLLRWNGTWCTLSSRLVIFGCIRWVSVVTSKQRRWYALIIIRLLFNVHAMERYLSEDCEFLDGTSIEGDSTCQCLWLDTLMTGMFQEVPELFDPSKFYNDDVLCSFR